MRRGDGHDFTVLRDTLAHFETVKDKPKVFIADTIKGKGVSFMEGIACGDQTYHFHAGAPSLENYVKATRELIARVNAKLEALGQPPAALTSAPLPVRISPKNPEKIVLAYGDELLEMARHRPEIIVMDADLLSDCGIEAFKAELPERFIECGIAEMHMVSAAGGMALRGMLPVVHSFACFLSTRANEHIYNNATEKKRIIYTATLAGLVPGGPGHSHQSVRDISAIGAVPGLVAFEPCSEKEARLAIRWAVEQNPESTYLRFVNVPLDLPYSMPADYALQVGRGVTLRSGTDVAIIGYGTILLTNAWKAADELAKQGISAAVIDLPWLNRIDDEWVKTLGAFGHIVTLDNHYLEYGQGVMIGAALARTGVRSQLSQIGLKEIPGLRIERRRARVSRARCGGHRADRAECAGELERRGLKSRPTHNYDVSQLRSALDRRRRGRAEGQHDVREAQSRDRPGDRASGARRRRRSGACACRRPRARRRRGRARRCRSAAPFSAARRSCCASAKRSSARSSRPRPASRGRTRSPKSARPPTWRSSWKARAAGCTARRCRARSRIARCRRCAARSAFARRSCRSTARSPASRGKCFRRCSAATPSS